MWREFGDLMRSRRMALPLVAVSLMMPRLAPGQSGTVKARVYAAPRTPYGKPDLQGIWEVQNTAAGSLEAHGASQGIRAGDSVIVDPTDGKIPYQTWAVTKQKENFEKRATADPLEKCFLPGVPRATYLPFPFQIFQTPNYIAITYEFAHAFRTIYMNGSKHPDGIDFWMGDSRGRWDGETLVVDVADYNDQTWLDKSGAFHSEALHVVERYTRTSPNTIQYEAAIEDPKVFTRPWKISMALHLRAEKNAQLFEYECHVYREVQAADGR